MAHLLNYNQWLKKGLSQAISALRPDRPNNSALEWAPSASFVMHTKTVSTSICFAPCTTTRAEAPYFWELRLYDRNPIVPIVVRKSGPLNLFAQEVIDSETLCQEAGLSELFHYCEVMAYSPSASPAGVSSVLVSYHHFRSTDGSFQAHLPAAYIWGAARFTRTEQFHYENFPAAHCSQDSSLVVITINPYVRPLHYWIRLVAAGGAIQEYGPYIVRGKGVQRWDAVGLPIHALENPVGVIVRSDSKATSFVGAIDAKSGCMIDLEHMHPFFAR